MSKPKFLSKPEGTEEVSESSTASTQKKSFLKKHMTWILALGLVLFISVVFKPCVYEGKAISKIYEVSKIDRFYNPENKAAVKFSPVDPFIYLFIPVYIYNHKILSSGQFPLWAPNNSTGYPHFASLDNGILHPLRLLFPVVSEYEYNLSIVLKVIISSLGMLGLVRCLGLSRWSAVFAASMYPLSPYILRDTEQCFETWSYPLVMWIFISMMRRSTVWSSTAIGVTAVFTVASLHPTSAIFVLGFSTIVGFLSIWFGSETKDRNRNLIQTAKYFALAILIGFCLSAPLLFSALELLSNSWTYKNIYSNSGVPWQPLALMLTNPIAGGASLSLGVIAAILFPLAVIFPNKKILPVTIIAVISFLSFTTITPINELFNIKPFTYLRPNYYLPIHLLFTTILAAYGLDIIRSKDFFKSKAKCLVFCLVFLVVLATPLLFRNLCIPFTGFRWDGGMPCFDISMNACKRDIVLALTLVASIFIGNKLWKYKLRWLIPASCIILSIISLMSVSRLTFPPHQSFFYPPKEPVQWLAKQGERCFGISSISSIYNIDNFYYHTSFYLTRYVEFLKKCGFERTYTRYSLKKLTPTIDLASVKYYISYSPVVCSDDKLELSFEKEFQDNQFVLSKGLSLKKFELSYDRANSQILGSIFFEADKNSVKDLGIQNVLLDKEGKELWSSEENPLNSIDKENELYKSPIKISIPSTVPEGSTISAAFRLNNLHSHKTINSPHDLLPMRYGNICLNDFRVEKSNSVNNKHFKLLFETKEGLRVYENTSALPRAYIVHNVVKASSMDKAFEAIAAPEFDARSSVVLEDAGSSKDRVESGASGEGPLESLPVTRPDNQTVSVKTNSKTEGILVLTDTYYPGWEAKVDGKTSELYVANGLFRGVKIPAGEHTVEFHFVPKSIYAGLILAVLCCLTLSGIFAIERFRKKEKDPDA